MDHVVAARLGMTDGTSRYFLTLGRIFDPVGPDRLVSAVAKQAAEYDLQGTVASVGLCEMPREAADSNDAPYFYEALLAAGRVPIPFGKTYGKWRRKTRKAMREGEFIYYCGGPSRT